MSWEETQIKMACLVDCMRRVERVCGLQGNQVKSDEALETQAVEWLKHPLLVHVPVEKYDELTSWSLENRSNATTGLTMQNLLQAARHYFASGIISLPERKPDANCGACGGRGAIFGLDPISGQASNDKRPYKLRRDPITGQLSGEGYTVARICPCSDRNAQRAIDPPLVGELMRALPELIGGPIPNVQRETEAARRLVAFGYTREEIINFWDICDKKADRPPLYSEIVSRIGPHYFLGLVRKLNINQQFEALALKSLGIKESEV